MTLTDKIRNTSLEEAAHLCDLLAGEGLKSGVDCHFCADRIRELKQKPATQALLQTSVTPEIEKHYESATELTRLQDENQRLVRERDELKQEQAALSSCLDREFNDGKGSKRSGDIIDDMTVFLDHHKRKEVLCEDLQSRLTTSDAERAKEDGHRFQMFYAIKEFLEIESERGTSRYADTIKLLRESVSSTTPNSVLERLRKAELDCERLDKWEGWFEEVFSSEGQFYLVSEMVVDKDDPFGMNNGPAYEFRQAIDAAIASKDAK